MKTMSKSFAVLAVSLMFGCTPQAPSTQVTKIESSTLPSPAEAGVLANPFCLHVKYQNNYYSLYSENYAEGWVTDGRCDVDGPRRSVQSIVLAWRYKGESLSSKQCSSADFCSFSERNYGIGKTIECSSSRARDGNQSAHATTDHVSCP